MSATVPAALAVAGTALMALAFFGPFRYKAADTDDAASANAARPATVSWPGLVAAAAVTCDAPTRIDLADALGALQSEWAEAILRKAYETEPDPGVRSAIATALSSSQSLVT